MRGGKVLRSRCSRAWYCRNKRVGYLGEAPPEPDGKPCFRHIHVTPHSAQASFALQVGAPMRIGLDVDSL